MDGASLAFASLMMCSRSCFHLVSFAAAMVFVFGALEPDGVAQKATVERSCQASFAIRLLDFVDGSGSLPFGPGQPEVEPAYSFSGRASCGTLVRNRCRRRASEVVWTCMKALVSTATTMDNQKDACPSVGRGSYVLGAFDFRFRDKLLQDYLAGYACAAANRWFDQHQPSRTEPARVRFDVDGRTSGDTGCGGGDRKSKTEKLATLVVSCPRVQHATFDRVVKQRLLYSVYNGSRMTLWYYEHYGNIKPMASAEECRRACLADSKCMAWGFLPFHDRPTMCNMFDHYTASESTADPAYVVGFK